MHVRAGRGLSLHSRRSLVPAAGTSFRVRLRQTSAVAAVGWLATALLACAHPESQPPARTAPTETHEVVAPPPEPAQHAGVQTGFATWYGGKLAGHKTANGERFDPTQMTAAHRSLPFGTWVEVKRVDTGESVRVRITDRGPFGHEERIIDLSKAAAKKLGMLKVGMAKVEVRIVTGP